MRFINAIIFITLLSALFLGTDAFSYEKSIIIELNNKITKDMIDLRIKKKSFKSKQRSIGQEMDELYKKIMTTKDEKRSQILTTKYLEKKKDMLMQYAKYVVSSQSKIGNVLDNMKILIEETKNQREKVFSTEAQKNITKMTMKSYGSILSYFQEEGVLTSNPKLQIIAERLLALDNNLKKYSHPKSSNLKNLKKMVEILEEYYVNLEILKSNINFQVQTTKVDTFANIIRGIVKNVGKYGALPGISLSEVNRDFEEMYKKEQLMSLTPFGVNKDLSLKAADSIPNADFSKMGDY